MKTQTACVVTSPMLPECKPWQRSRPAASKCTELCFPSLSQIESIYSFLGLQDSLMSSRALVLWIWLLLNHKRSHTYSWLIPLFQCRNAKQKVHSLQRFSCSLARVFLGHLTWERVTFRCCTLVLTACFHGNLSTEGMGLCIFFFFFELRLFSQV